MSDHVLAWLAGLAVGVITTIVGALATRVQMRPDIVDLRAALARTRARR